MNVLLKTEQYVILLITLNIPRSNVHSLKQRNGRCPWTGGALLCCDGCFHASPVGASSCAHKESRARGCAQCEYPLRGTTVLSASWQHLVECNTTVSRNNSLRARTVASSSRAHSTHRLWNLPRHRLLSVPSSKTERRTLKRSRSKCRAQTLLEQRATSSLACERTRVAEKRDVILSPEPERTHLTR